MRAQLYLALLLVLCAFVAVLCVAPYLTARDNRLEAASLTVSAFTLVAALAMHGEQAWTPFWAGLGLLAHVCFLGGALLDGGRSCFRMRALHGSHPTIDASALHDGQRGLRSIQRRLLGVVESLPSLRGEVRIAQHEVARTLSLLQTLLRLVPGTAADLPPGLGDEDEREEEPEAASHGVTPSSERPRTAEAKRQTRMLLDSPRARATVEAPALRPRDRKDQETRLRAAVAASPYWEQTPSSLRLQLEKTRDWDAPGDMPQLKGDMVRALVEADLAQEARRGLDPEPEPELTGSLEERAALVPVPKLPATEPGLWTTMVSRVGATLSHAVGRLRGVRRASPSGTTVRVVPRGGGVRESSYRGGRTREHGNVK